MIEDLPQESYRFPAIPGSRSYRPTNDMTILRDQHGRREPTDHKPAGEFLVFIEKNRQIDAKMVEKLPDALRIHVRRHGHDADL